MAPILRVDDEVYEALKKRAIPFEDTPNSVLRRILRIDTATSARRKNIQKRAPRGSGTPQREYEIPILRAVNELGGSARAGEVLDTLYPKMKAKLKQHDYERTSAAEPIWRNTARWARQDLVNKSLLKKDSRPGTWEITEAGRRLVQNK